MFDVMADLREKISECFVDAIGDAVACTVGDSVDVSIDGMDIQDFIYDIADCDLNKLESVLEVYKELDKQWEAKKPTEPAIDASDADWERFFALQDAFYTDYCIDMGGALRGVA